MWKRKGEAEAWGTERKRENSKKKKKIYRLCKRVKECEKECQQINCSVSLVDE